MGSQGVRDRIALLVLINQASQAVANGVVDGILSVLLIAAYLLTRGYQATRAKA